MKKIYLSCMSIILLMSMNTVDAKTVSDDAFSAPYYNCSSAVSKKIEKLLNYNYRFKDKEKDCLIIDEHQALFAVSLPVEQSHADSPYLLRIYLVNYNAPKKLTILEKVEMLYSSYENFEGIFFDLVHFSTFLKNRHVIGLRHNWSMYKSQTNSANEYLELIEVQNNQKLRFILNDLPTKSHYFSRGECPENQATWGADIRSIIRLSPKQHHGLQDLIFKQIYTHNEAHQNSGCKPVKNSQYFQFTFPFDDQKYQYLQEDLMQIDAI